MKNTFDKLIEKDSCFKDFISQIIKTANFEVAHGNNNDQELAVFLCLAAAFEAGQKSMIRFENIKYCSISSPDIEDKK